MSIRSKSEPDKNVERFNPFGLHAIRLPLALLPYKGVSWGAKVLYARLAYYLGKPGRRDARCDPSVETLAAEMATTVSTVDRWLKELIEEKFLVRKRRGRTTLECILLPHPILVESAFLRTQDDAQSTQDCGLGDAPECANLESRVRNYEALSTQKCTAPYKEENIHENIQENESSSEVAVLVNERDDEAALFSGNEKPKPDREWVISEAQKVLRSERAKSLGVPLTDVGEPDREITEQILQAFTDGADFLEWVPGTTRRRLGQKCRDARWGLYLTDARNQAEDIRTKRERAEKEQADALIAEERERAAEAERQRQMEVPISAAEAIQLAGRVPSVLERRLLRLGNAVSVAAVQAAAVGWRKCSSCFDKGLVGTALAKTLAFCECPAGEEERNERGAVYPEQEIARVHSSLKSRMAAAALELSLGFFADALGGASTEVLDADPVVIRVSHGNRLCVVDSDIRKALGFLGIHRPHTLIVKAEAAA